MDERRDDRVVVIERSDNGMVGLLWGLAIGAGMALLFAPRSGEETRRDLRERGRRLREVAADRAEDLQEVLAGGYERARDRMEDGFETAKQTLGDKREGARDAVEAGKAAVRSARDELETRLSKSRSTRARAGVSADEVADDE